MTKLKTVLLASGAAILSASAFTALPARAQDESAMQQLQDEAHSSNDAANADSDEQAKDDSNQGFDTPNDDPAPPSDDSSSDGN